MSHKDELKRQIRELEEKIARDEGAKLQLQTELNRLKLAEFEEDLRESDNRQLLKGQCCFNTTLPIDNFLGSVIIQELWKF